KARPANGIDGAPVQSEIEAPVDLAKFLRAEGLHSEAQALKAESTQQSDLVLVECFGAGLDAPVRAGGIDTEHVGPMTDRAAALIVVQIRRGTAAEVKSGKTRSWPENVGIGAHLPAEGVKIPLGGGGGGGGGGGVFVFAGDVGEQVAERAALIAERNVNVTEQRLPARFIGPDPSQG